jgi:hypothetical protein
MQKKTERSRRKEELPQGRQFFLYMLFGSEKYTAGLS